MSKRNLSYKFDNFEINNCNKKVFNNLINYSEKLVNNIEKKGVILVGNNGVGKTHLACSIANRFIEKGIPVIYGTLINLLAELRNSYEIDNNISEMEIIKLYENVDLLIIDDLGTESLNSMKLSELFIILNTRLLNSNNKVTKTIISTNLSINDIFKFYEERIGSRIVGYYDIYYFFGNDLRFIKNK